MHRRAFLTATGASLAVTLSGCLGGSNDAPSDQSTVSPTPTDARSRRGGGLIAETVDTVPSDATVVNATSGRLANVDPIQTVLKRASNRDTGRAVLSLDATAFTDATDVLASLPRYSGPGQTGYYMSYNGHVILVYPFYLTASTNTTTTTSE